MTGVMMTMRNVKNFSTKKYYLLIIFFNAKDLMKDKQKRKLRKWKEKWTHKKKLKLKGQKKY